MLNMLSGILTRIISWLNDALEWGNNAYMVAEFKLTVEYAVKWLHTFGIILGVVNDSVKQGQ